MGRQKRGKRKAYQNKPRRNLQIRAQEVRVIGNDGENLGVMNRDEAIKKAKDEGLDLIEISAKANPPVARIMEYGKYMYQQEKKEKEAKKNSQQPGNVMKGVRFGMQTSDHDIEIRTKRVDKWLKKGYKVRVQLTMKGREKAYRERGEEQIQEFLDKLTEEYEMDEKPKRHPRGMQFTIRSK